MCLLAVYATFLTGLRASVKSEPGSEPTKVAVALVQRSEHAASERDVKMTSEIFLHYLHGTRKWFRIPFLALFFW